MWSGEYAVLEGAPAVVAAVDRRVHVRVMDREGDGWSIRTDLDGRVHVLRRDDAGALRLPDGADAKASRSTRLAALVLEDAAANGPLPPLAIEVESRSLRARDGRSKLGIGSSAAACVALQAAVTAHLDRQGAAPPRRAAGGLQASLRIHRALQHGRGSGADVAAAHEGGILRFVRTNSDAAVRVRFVHPPRGLCWKAVWTGTAASTPHYLAQLETARLARPHRIADVMERLRMRAVEASDAFESQTVPRILAAIDAYREGLELLGDAIRCEILTTPHRVLARLAEREGAVYKPSGAGGGDVGVLFSDSTHALDLAVEAAASEGYGPLAVAVDPRGVTFEEEGRDEP
jgi:phosphomevalonate kinase